MLFPFCSYSKRPIFQKRRLIVRKAMGTKTVVFFWAPTFPVIEFLWRLSAPASIFLLLIFLMSGGCGYRYGYGYGYVSVVWPGQYNSIDGAIGLTRMDLAAPQLFN